MFFVCPLAAIVIAALDCPYVRALNHRCDEFSSILHKNTVVKKNTPDGSICIHIQLEAKGKKSVKTSTKETIKKENKLIIKVIQ